MRQYNHQGQGKRTEPSGDFEKGRGSKSRNDSKTSGQNKRVSSLEPRQKYKSSDLSAKEAADAKAASRGLNKKQNNGLSSAMNKKQGLPSTRVKESYRKSEVFTEKNQESSIPDEERLEGRNAVAEALAAGRTFNKVWYLKPLPGKQTDRRLNEILQQFHQTSTVLYPVDRKTLDRMAVTPSHQGIIAQVAAHDYVEVEDILALAREKNEEPFLILLDQIQDSQNLGAIMRTADAVGAHGIVIPRRRSVALDAACAKASAGAIEHVKCARVTNLNRTILDLKEKGIWICGLAVDGEPIYQSSSLDLPIALVVGSEGFGLSQSVQDHCDFLLEIPMRGKINSLNASNAAAVVMYEVLRQRLKKVE